jgi:hypothetical protein
MIGYYSVATFDSAQFAFSHQVGDDLGMVDHLEIAAKRWVFMFQGVVAVRAAGNYLFDTVMLKQRNVSLRLELEKVLVTQPAGWVAAAGLFHT